MKLLHLWTLVSILALWKHVQAQQAEPISSQAGIYYDEIGTISFYPTTWKVVSYLNLQPTRDLWRKVKDHYRQVVSYCQTLEKKPWYQYTDCSSFKQYVASKIEYIDNIKELVAEYLKPEQQNNRRKRGVLDFVGEISKTLFGTLTQADAKECNRHINQLEKEQKEFLHISSEQMTVIKSAIQSIGSTVQNIDKNEKLLRDIILQLNEQVANASVTLQTEVEQVTTANLQIATVERGVIECQHGYEILLEALVHAEQGTFQPKFVTAERIRAVLTSQQLPSGMDYPNFPFSELQRIVVPHVYAHESFLVYVLDIPLLFPTLYQLYKVLPYPIPRQDIFVFINPSKEYIFVDSIKRQFGKMTTTELTGCFQPNPLRKVCKANIPVYTHIPNLDCEMTLIHPLSTQVPKSCEVRVIELVKTYWIPLFMSNQWLYVTPKSEKLSVLCGENAKQVDLTGRGKLTLHPGCKAYTSYVTLYAMSTNVKNISNDFLPIVSMDFDCCSLFEQTRDFSQLSLSIPLSNILSSVDDLRVASHKIDEVEKMIDEQKEQDYSQYYRHVTSWSGVMGAMIFLIVSCCCCCCYCKGYRLLWFKLWDRWSPKTCWKETTEKLCINITNVHGKKPSVHYQTTQVSPTTSIRSLPDTLTIFPNDEETKEATEPLQGFPRRSLRKKRIFR
jgi:hypothetical protein